MSMEFQVVAETHEGKTLTLRRGFVSREAAEDHPIQMKNWKRVWVEERANGQSRPVSERPTASDHQADVEACFDTLARAAAAGERCPMNDTFGVRSSLTSALAAAGRIKIEVYAKNWRVVTILTGEHRGKRTAEPPIRCGPPYVVITKDGRSRRPW